MNSIDSNKETLAGVQVRLLVENTARGAGILGEHGLSYWIESNVRSLLFDLGQGLTMEALFFRTAAGLVVILGCAHAGQSFIFP